VIATAIITGLGYSGFVYILPYYSAPFSWSYLCNAATGPPDLFSHSPPSTIGVFILGNIYYNYFCAVLTSPGTPDKDLYAIDDPESLRVQERLKQCKKCNVVKPPRAHHCSMCDRCTLRMDHHCPWVNNCVGLGNYRFFVLFLFWTTFGTAYLTVLSTPPVLAIIRTEISRTTEVSEALKGPFSFFPFSANETTGGLSQLWSAVEEKQKKWKEEFSLRGASPTALLRHPTTRRLEKSQEPKDEEPQRRLTERKSRLSTQAFRRDQELSVGHEPAPVDSSRGITTWTILQLFLRPRLFSNVIDELDRRTFPVVVTFLTASAVHLAVMMLFLFHAYLGQPLAPSPA
jgi:hypothetical protein